MGMWNQGQLEYAQQTMGIDLNEMDPSSSAYNPENMNIWAQNGIDLAGLNATATDSPWGQGNQDTQGNQGSQGGGGGGGGGEASYDNYTTPTIYGGAEWAKLDARASIAAEQQRRYERNRAERLPYLEAAIGKKQADGSYGSASDRGALGRLTDLAFGITPVEETPEYKWNKQEAERSVKRAAAAGSYFQSPRMLEEMNQRIQGLATTRYQQAYNNLAKLAVGLPNVVADMGASLGGSPDFPTFDSFRKKYGGMFDAVTNTGGAPVGRTENNPSNQDNQTVGGATPPPSDPAGANVPYGVQNYVDTQFTGDGHRTGGGSFVFTPQQQLNLAWHNYNRPIGSRSL